jgi:Secretion system C-terminal sorting domain
MKTQYHVIPRYLHNDRLCSTIKCLLVCFLIGYVFPNPVAAQVNNTGPLYISGNVYINTTFTNASTAAYQNDGSLNLTGNFTNDQAAMAEGTGATLFIGNSLQNISGTQRPVFHDVTLKNTAGVQMNISTTMGGTISPVTGSLYFNGYALTMGGKINTAYTNTSAFNVTPTSDLKITGDAATGNDLYFAASGDTLHDLTVSSTGTGKLGNALNITAGSSFGTVTMDGSFEAAGFLTLKSDAKGTARVNTSAGTITGNVTVERYIPARRAWRFLSVPVNSTQTIRDAWQEGVNNPSLTVRYNPNPGFGTHITGDNNTANGFDYNTTYNPSVKTWVYSTNSWSITAPPTVSTLINAYPAYYIFVRGSRAVDLAKATSAIADPTVLRITGTVNNRAFSKPFTGLTTNNFVFAGNPYASSVNISPVLKRSTGVDTSKFWVWDPALAGDYGVGGYITYSNGVMMPPTPNYPVATTIIQGGQAFLLQANAASANLNFIQADKTASESMVFGRPVKQPSPVVVYVNLMTPSADSLALTDGVASAFGKNYSASPDARDAIKQWNLYEGIALVRDSQNFAIEFRPIPQKTDTLFLRLYLRQQPYSLEIFSQNLPADFPGKAWIVDKYLGTQTEVNPYDTTLYSFTPNTDTNSFRNRFMLVFKRANIKTVNTDKEKEVVTTAAAGTGIYPNPVTDNYFNLVLNNLKAGNYGVNIYTGTGRLVLTHKISYEINKASYSIRLPAGLGAGSYTLQILNSNGDKVKSIPFIITGK